MESTNKTFLPIYLIVLIEGFVTISLEILTLRQLMPLVGNSIIVTSLIIGVFLLFLAYGYRDGGKHKTDHKKILKRNFLLASIGFGIGLSAIFTDRFFAFFQLFMPNYPLIVLLIYLLFIIAPIIYLLGQTVPITLNLWHKRDSVSLMGGEILHLSTIGSFLGATVTAILFLNFFGVAWTVFIDFMLLLSLIFFLSDLNIRFLQLVGVTGLTLIVAWLNISFENMLFVETNNYGNYQVRNDNERDILLINNSYSSAIDKNLKGFPYIEYIKGILFADLKLSGKKILVIGAGGFTLTAEGTHNNVVDYVDIDAKIKNIVEKNFLKQINGNFIAEDGRNYLHNKNEIYDVIVSDAYSNHYNIAPHLVTIEHYTQIKHALKANGIAIFNIVAKADFSDDYSKRMDSTLRHVFGNCTSTPLNFGNTITNIIYVCYKQPNNDDKLHYTDNLNRSSWDYFYLNKSNK